MKIHQKFQNGIEKLFFKGNSNKWSERISYWLGNLFVMLLLFFIGIQLILYEWTGQLYSEGEGYHLDFVFGPLDNLIPFVPEMAIFYVFLFYSMVVLTMLYFAFVDYDKGYALGWSLVIIGAISILIYIFFPVSTYWWRQELLSNKIEGNYFADVMYDYYQSDTSFNCLPSLHAAVSTICALTWYQYYKLDKTLPRKIIAIISIIIAIGVVLSTLFVKQHYIIDEFIGVFLAYAVGKYVFFYLWKDFGVQEYRYE
ncbi:MAG: phosphatase PAP2 family protein [Promethearchaeia archaeon]